jgi:hypothetical protein
MAHDHTDLIAARGRNRARQVFELDGSALQRRGPRRRSLNAGKGWSRMPSWGYYKNTFTSTDRSNVVLTLTGARLDRLGIVATACSSCRETGIDVRSTLIGKIDLHALSTHKQQLIMLPRPSCRTRTVKITMLTVASGCRSMGSSSAGREDSTSSTVSSK